MQKNSPNFTLPLLSAGIFPLFRTLICQTDRQTERRAAAMRELSVTSTLVLELRPISLSL